ncbi:hypothetical protein [Alicyclobacillus dauci]|uniref:Uncharacterized protein n=1 Tax=Alicyclobacillus dauci TaxID=1475485 RepID=A0ABY6Z1W7_9BACL|nr:hypothetical protein [Alicyclobacillus dauci]WAH35975.1 hypothetical protein NZD86_17155 [Alicyclobacillus dauci]
MNELLADITLLFRNDPSIASYNLRLRWLETSFIFMWLELFQGFSDDEPEIVDICEKYLAQISKQVEEVNNDILDCIHVLFIINMMFQKGQKWETPQAYVKFTPETLVG